MNRPFLDLWLRKNRAWKSFDYRNVIVFKMFSAQFFRFVRFKEKFLKAPFHDELVWTERQSVEIKLRLQIFSSGLSVEVSLEKEENVLFSLGERRLCCSGEL